MGIKYKHTMKFTGLIASALMLLLAVMASTASARSIEFPDQPQKFCCNAIEAKCEACKAGVSVDEICRTWVVDSSDPFSVHSRPLPGCPTEQPPICCNAYNAKCEACKFGITVEEMCRVHEEDMALDSHLQPLQGCPKKPKKCCRANTLECQACNAGVSEEEFCRRNPHSHVCAQKKQCCRAFTLECQACDADLSEEEFCRRNPHSHVCPQKPTKPSHPDNCYSKIWNKEVMHGEMGARKCCWYGDWKKKSKCEKKTSHPDNCYSTIWNTEVMHGEMGAKKCCWKGDWKRKSKCNGGHKDD